MATNTSKFNLSKPDYADTADIAVINSNMDKVDTALDGLGSGLAIISKANTHAAITAGQYVYVHNHSSLSDGLYIAKNNISANGTLSSSNLDATTKGGFNSILDKMGEMVPSKITRFGNSKGAVLTIPNNGRHMFILSGAGLSRLAAIIENTASNGSTSFANLIRLNEAGDYVTITASDNTITFSLSNTDSGTNVVVCDFVIQGDFATATNIPI